jgi:hypothetical protein
MAVFWERTHIFDLNSIQPERTGRQKCKELFGKKKLDSICTSQSLTLQTQPSASVLCCPGLPKYLKPEPQLCS